MVTIFYLVSVNTYVANSSVGVLDHTQRRCQVAAAVFFVMQAGGQNPQVYLGASQYILFDCKGSFLCSQNFAGKRLRKRFAKTAEQFLVGHAQRHCHPVSRRH